jgi:hypothetical protein
MRPGTWEWSPDLAKYPAELQAVYLAKSSGGATGGGGGGRMPNMSDHPVDRLIRQVVARRRTASAAEVAAIVERLATADFNRNLVKVPTAMRGLNYLGKELGERADALIYHLTKRVVEEKQWADGTTIADYLRDLREAVHDSQARLIVYTSRGEVFAAVLAPNRIPPERLGLNPEKFVWVVHSAVRGTLATGYQVGGPETVRLGKDALWLK